MTPAAKAAAIYRREECARSFAEDLDAHLQCPTGYVFSAPDFFMMGRAVPSGEGIERLRNPWVWFRRVECDTWWIYLAAGDMAKFWAVEPYPQKFVAFERANAPRFYDCARIRNRILPCLTISPPT